ncbi:hypothetical protein [Paraflavitalea sp. CAU 1676]|uniref:hypothetical protein n=1 Tax=Paraflavitalea sp. CAU 1676 TaxID=3032598 RepID=UPI0023DCD2A5|nr:hypothetical protein [Paraflavitalea sp. CAU 1676]MDF2190982.1 hypothetical protein [Paraflavitalea sp. CAU 1676]
MKKLFVVAGMLATLVFTSCKKDKDNDDNTGGGGNNPSTKLIKKLTETENGTTTVYNFTYDGNKRLTNYGSADGKEQTKFTYDAAGNLTKLEIIDEESKIEYTYAYSNNVPVSGTMKTWELHGAQPDELITDNSVTYTVANGQVTKMKRVIKEDDEEYVMNLNLTYTNGNVTKIQTETGSILEYSAVFTFGDKKSPFPQLSKYILDEAGFSVMFSSKNELKTATYDWPGQVGDFGFSNTYTYDGSGYPLTSTDGTTQVKYEYQ